MLVRDIMQQQVQTIEIDATVADAVQKMSETQVDSLVVMKGQKVVGLLTGEDLALGCLGEGHRAWECLLFRHMSMPVITATPDMDILDAARLMLQKHIRHLPVVASDKVVGIVAMSDIVQAILANYGEALARASSR